MDVVINYLAVVASAVAAMVIGFLWYGPLFGKKWTALMGFSPDSIMGMKQKANVSYAIMAVGSLLLAYVLAYMLGISEKAFGVLDVSGALMGGFWLWLGFVATTQVSVVLWEGKSWNLFFLNTAHSLVSIEVMAIILALWR